MKSTNRFTCRVLLVLALAVPAAWTGAQSDDEPVTDEEIAELEERRNLNVQIEGDRSMTPGDSQILTNDKKNSQGLKVRY